MDLEICSGRCTGTGSLGLTRDTAFTYSLGKHHYSLLSFTLSQLDFGWDRVKFLQFLLSYYGAVFCI